MKHSNLEENKAIVQRYVDEIQNEHNLDAIESIFSSDFIDHMDSLGCLFQGLDGLKRGYAALLNAFPDLHVTVENMIAEGDTVVAYKTLSGTHRGPHLGIHPTNKRVKYQIVSIYRIKNGKIAGYWGIQDELSLRRQLGVVE